MSLSLSISPYLGFQREELIAVTVYVPKAEYEQLRRSCLGQGDLSGALAFCYANLVREVKKTINNTTTYEPSNREAFRDIARRVRFERATTSRSSEPNQRATDRDDQEVTEP